MLVLTMWKDAVNTLTVHKMRIEARKKNQIWVQPPSYNISKHDETTVHSQFHRTDIIPMSVQGWVTKLTVVLKFVEIYSNQYDLETITNILVGFSALEVLTIVHVANPCGTFCNLFCHPNGFPSHHYKNWNLLVIVIYVMRFSTLYWLRPILKSQQWPSTIQGSFHPWITVTAVEIVEKEPNMSWCWLWVWWR